MSEQKKVAFITGANKGIGFETARQLGRQGVTILLGARDLAKGEAAVEKLKAEGIEARPVKLDVVRSEDIKAAAEMIGRDFGHLDILINNAGVMVEPMDWNAHTVLDVSPEQMHETFATNLFATVELTQALLPLLRKAPAARIVNLSSILGSQTMHAKPGALATKPFAYDSSKAALNSFTIHLAAALHDTKIKVNSAHPGWVKTDMGTDAAPMEIEDGAKTSVRLATLPEDGPTGGYFHMNDTLPW